MAHGSVAVPYRWDQRFIPHGTGDVSCARHFGATSVVLTHEHLEAPAGP
jgi:hypothetical protein